MAMASIGPALGPLLLLSMATLAYSCNEQEKASLLQFLTGLSQDNGLAASWQNDNTDCCKWEGITCSGNGAVVEVSLAFRGLQGCISSSLGDLNNLQSLNLSYNSFTGSLPTELLASSSIVVLDVSFNQLSRVQQPQESNSSVTNNRPLQVLNISSNLFTGEFPYAVWEKTSSLVVLNASNNNFQGLMPSSFCISSSSFAVLDLNHNNFNGSIPAGLGKCSALRILKAGYNSLSGPLPDELFNASSLEYLSFPNNGLHGVLDSARIINLKNLCHLDVGSNMLTGKIPDSIGQIKRLQELRLCHNQMSGELPSALSNCTNLVTVNLKINKFSGELNKFNFSNLINLKILDLLENNFTGKFPESLYSCSNLTALRLSMNNLHGQLSPRIGELKSLAFLSLSTLNLSFNYLSGEIPQQLCSLTNLEVLDLSNNYLTGEIPLALNKLTFLAKFNVSNNDLEGLIPTGGQFDTFPNSSFEGNPKLGAHMVNQLYGLVEASAVPSLSMEQADRRVTFVIGFCAFFGVGLLYDQLVLSKFYG